MEIHLRTGRLSTSRTKENVERAIQKARNGRCRLTVRMNANELEENCKCVDNPYERSEDEEDLCKLVTRLLNDKERRVTTSRNNSKPNQA